jgi:hypothetical protein
MMQILSRLRDDDKSKVLTIAHNVENFLTERGIARKLIQAVRTPTT